MCHALWRALLAITQGSLPSPTCRPKQRSPGCGGHTRERGAHVFFIRPPSCLSPLKAVGPLLANGRSRASGAAGPFAAACEHAPYETKIPSVRKRSLRLDEFSLFPLSENLSAQTTLAKLRRAHARARCPRFFIRPPFCLSPLKAVGPLLANGRSRASGAAGRFAAACEHAPYETKIPSVRKRSLRLDGFSLSPPL